MTAIQVHIRLLFVYVMRHVYLKQGFYSLKVHYFLPEDEHFKCYIPQNS